MIRERRIVPALVKIIHQDEEALSAIRYLKGVVLKCIYLCNVAKFTFEMNAKFS